MGGEGKWFLYFTPSLKLRKLSKISKITKITKIINKKPPEVRSVEHDDGAGRGSAGPGRLAARPQHRPRHPAQWGRLSH